jgi:hypothetical protein
MPRLQPMNTAHHILKICNTRRTPLSETGL